MSGFKLLGGGSSLDTVVSDMNTNILELKNQDVTKIFKDDQGTKVVILDQNGLRTTTPGSGVDVTTASDTQLSSDSSKSTLRIVESGTVTIAAATVAGGGNTTVSGIGTFTNSYTTRPIVLGFPTVSGSTGGLWADGMTPTSFTWGTSGTITIQMMTINTQTTTTTDVTFSKRHINGTAGSNLFAGATIIYYVLQQGAA